jgi:high-affinity nickel permease
MTALLLVLATALMLGALHAFDADHLAAVTSFIARRPAPRSAFGFAIRWALGHSATLLVVGTASVLFRLAIAPSIEKAAELAVGVVLVGVGLWVLQGLRRGRLLIERHIHDGHEHTHLHRPEHPHATPARHSIFWVGALHGLAGSAGLLVIIPVAMLSSIWTVMAYIVMFSLGVATAMALYALLMGRVLGRIAESEAGHWYPWLQGAAGCLTLLLGLTWIGGTLA